MIFIYILFLFYFGILILFGYIWLVCGLIIIIDMRDEGVFGSESNIWENKLGIISLVFFFDFLRSCLLVLELGGFLCISSSIE